MTTADDRASSENDEQSRETASGTQNTEPIAAVMKGPSEPRTVGNESDLRPKIQAIHRDPNLTDAEKSKAVFELMTNRRKVSDMLEQTRTASKALMMFVTFTPETVREAARRVEADWARPPDPYWDQFNPPPKMVIHDLAIKHVTKMALKRGPETFWGLSQLTHADGRSICPDVGEPLKAAAEDLVIELAHRDANNDARLEFLGSLGITDAIEMERIALDSYHPLNPDVLAIFDSIWYLLQYLPFARSEETDGCKHYMRKCQIYCDICDTAYPCRFCHDEAVVDGHTLDRASITRMHCISCDKAGPVGQNCAHCGIEVASYFCAKCHMLDDHPCKEIYHCDRCGHCLVGTGDVDTHCDQCECCYPTLAVLAVHRCNADVPTEFNRECPVCFGNMKASKHPPLLLPCGHAVHTSCHSDMLNSGNVVCPRCQKLVLEGRDRDGWEADMRQRARQFEFEVEIQRSVIPDREQLADFNRNFERTMNLQCRECETKFTKDSWSIMYQCPQCETFNVTVI